MCFAPEADSRPAPVAATPATPPGAAELVPARNTNHIDRAHARMSDWVNGAAERLDALLVSVFPDHVPYTNAVLNTTPPFELPGCHSLVTVSPGITFSEKDGTQFRSRFSANLNLPSLTNRVQIIVNNVQEDEDVLQDVTDPFSRERRVQGEKDKTAGLRLSLIDRLRFDLAASGGARFKPEPVPKLRLKGRLRFVQGSTRYEFRETGFWQSDDGFGEKSEAAISHALSDRLSINNTAAVLVEEVTDGAVLGDTIALRYRFPRQRTLGLTMGVEWRTQPTAAVNFYALRIPYRQGIWRDWMYLRIEPGADFADEDDYNMNSLITVGFDFQFGDVPHGLP